MAMINSAYAQLPPAFFFTRITETVDAYAAVHPDQHLLKLGVGDVTGPLSPAVIEAMRRAVSEQSQSRTFHGYLYEPGLDFFRSAVADYYGQRKVRLSPEDVFISSGAADDLGSIGHLFTSSARVLGVEPAYPS